MEHVLVVLLVVESRERLLRDDVDNALILHQRQLVAPNFNRNEITDLCFWLITRDVDSEGDRELCGIIHGKHAIVKRVRLM